MLCPIDFFPGLGNNWVRFFLRFALYTGYLVAAKGSSLSLCMYGGALCAAVYTLCHNILLTPITRPLLSVQVSFSTSPLLNLSLCAGIVYGTKAILYVCVFRSAPLSPALQVSAVRAAVLAAVVITSLYIVESCAKVPRDAPRFLEVRGGPSANLLLFQVSNSCVGAVPMAGPLPRTTKADREHHGFGLSSIARALEPYGGTLTVTPGEGRFTLTIAIPIPEEASPCTKSQFVTTNPSSGTPF